jgi:uncharacterized membrane protein
MANEPIPTEGMPPDEDSQAARQILSPPQDQAFVADTNSAVTSGGEAAAQFGTNKSLANQGLRYVGIDYHETRVHIGPIPDPETIQRLAEIYPDAPRMIFEDFHAQSAHRRDLERMVVTTKNMLALRGQIIGGILGALGLIGSLIVAGVGHGWAGFGIAMGSLVSLVSVFVFGREQEKRERLEKENLREKIKRGAPIEKLEKTDAPRP